MSQLAPIPLERSLAQLAEEVRRAQDYAGRAKAPSTVKAYSASWRDFTTWADAHDRAALPATPELADTFTGAGVYALFYNGDFEPYAPLRSPEGVRPSRSPGSPLYGRIFEHVQSIQAARNLDIQDFACRYLAVTPLWITMAERFLIENFRPIWNTCIDGVGLHNPGSGRWQGEIPWWDALHPGRAWAARLRQTRTYNAASEQLQDCLGGLQRPVHEPPVVMDVISDEDDILEQDDP